MAEMTEASLADIWNQIAVDLAQRGKMSAAVGACRRAVLVDGGRADLRSNLGNMLRRAGRPEEGLGQLMASRAIDKAFIPALFNTGVSYMEMGRPDAAIACFDACLKTDGTNGDWLFARASAHLMAANWRLGWADYESRLDKLEGGGSMPLWDGKAPGTVLIHAEQGFGDTIMMQRFVERAFNETAARFCVQAPLARLFRAEQIGEEIEADYRLPLMSLPHVLGIESVSGGPYLNPVHRLVLPPVPGARAKVGIVWKAKATWHHMKVDEYLHGLAKSMPFESMLELCNLHGVALYSMQKGSDDIREAGAGHLVTDLQDQIFDFADCASFMAQMDAIVTVDTATAHLAGALGKPTVVCLPHSFNWQWGTGDRSVWYDSVRIVRQKHPGVWPMDSIVAEVDRCLTTVMPPS